MEEVNGKVERISPWSKGNGYFLKLEGDETDYAGYTKNCPEAGDEVKLEVEPGTKNFSDKMVIKEFAAKKGEGKQAEPEEKKPVVHKKDMSGTKETPKFTVNESIERQVAFKGAIELVKESTKTGKPVTASDVIPDLYQAFEKCLKILKGDFK